LSEEEATLPGETALPTMQACWPKMNWNLPALLSVFLVVTLGAAFFATPPLIIVCLVETRERFMDTSNDAALDLIGASSV
jgi:hypothetical protein